MTGRTDSRRPTRTTSSTRKSRFARSSGTSGRRWGSSSGTTRGCCAWAPATIRARGSSTSSRCFTTSTSRRFTNLDNNLVESWDLYIAPLDWHFKSGDSVHAVFDVNPTYERLFETFEISPGVFLPPGEYRFTRFRSNAVSAARRPLSGSVSIGTGTYWSGQAEQVTASLRFKLPPWFTMSVSTNQTFARLPEGNFIARIYTSNIGYTASPRLSFSNLDSVRQPLEEPRMAEPRAVDAAARQRFFLRVQPGLGAGGRREPEPAVPSAGHQGVGEVPGTRHRF